MATIGVDTPAKAQRDRKVHRGFLSFFVHWNTPKLMAFAWVVLWGLGEGFAVGSIEPPPPAWRGLALTVVGFLGVWIWLLKERLRFPEQVSHYGGVGLFVAWPFLLPLYVMETRGWRRTAAGILLVLLLALGSFVAGAGVSAFLRAG